MKNTTLLLLAISSMMLIFTGCPYSSEVAIDKPNIKVDKSILGKWTKSGGNSDHPEYFEFSQKDANIYEVIDHEWSDNDSTYTPTVYAGHLTKIDDYLFLNMKPQDPDGLFGPQDAYYLYRIDFNDTKTEFVLYEVTDNIDEQFDKSEDLYAFVKANMHLSFFYNNAEATYTKD